MSHFSHENVNFDVLKKKAFNYRWAEIPEGVIPLTAADSDFPAAPEIIEDIINYVKDGYLSYTPKLGLQEFRESIAESINRRKDEHINPEFVLPIDSAARGMYIIAQAMLAEGDEMIIFDPVDYLFKQSALSAKATPVYFPSVLDEEGYIDLSGLEALITPKTKMIGLCNPHNPLGTLYRKEDLLHILNLAEKYNLYIMNDEIWSDIVYPERDFISILSVNPELNKRVLSVYGFSKCYGVAGLRIGCIYAHDAEIFDKLVAASDVMTTAGGIASISQIAGISCLNKADYMVKNYVEHLTKNRDMVCERINAMPMLSCRRPEATFVVFIDVRETGLSSTEFTDFMMEKAKLALVPGSEQFFGKGAEGFVRLCFATSREILSEGLDRLEKGIMMLKK